MSAQCPEFERLRIAARPESASALEHLRSCASCEFEYNELQQWSRALRDLGHSETAGAGSDLWSGVAARLEAPSLLDRVPLQLAGATRLLGVLTQPTVATAWATGIAGLLLGLWVGSPRSEAEPATPYAEASLLEGTDAGLLDMYAESFAPDAATAARDGEDSTGAPLDTTDDSP